MRLNNSNSFKPRNRNEGIGVFTPGAQLLSVLPKLRMASGLQTTGKPLHEARQIVEDLIGSRDGYLGKP